MQALQQAKQDLNLQDFYDIGLWGYCSGNKTSNNFVVNFCSKPKAEFWFNPVDIWKLNNTGVQNLLPQNLQTALDTYQNVSKWMFIAYAVAFVATIVELLVGITAIFSRLGSLVTSLVSGVRLPSPGWLGSSLTPPPPGFCLVYHRRLGDGDRPVRRPDRHLRFRPEAIRNQREHGPEYLRGDVLCRPLFAGGHFVLAVQLLLLLRSISVPRRPSGSRSPHGRKGTLHIRTSREPVRGRCQPSRGQPQPQPQQPSHAKFPPRCL